MKFIRNLKFDIRNGIFKKPFLFLFPFIIATITFSDAFIRIRKLEDFQTPVTRMVSLGDYWFYAYGGMKEYIPSPYNPFQFPVIWVILFLTLSFILLTYPMKDLHNIGAQMLIRSSSRSQWWLSKCLWIFTGTLLYHTLFLGTLTALCAIFHIPLTASIHTELLKLLFSMDIDTELLTRTFIPLSVFILPPLFSAAINILQMTLSLFMKPIFSFLIIAILMLSSAYLLSPWLLGNYAMPLRYKWILANGISHKTGIIFSVTLLLLSLICGLYCFRKYDILNDN